MHLNPSVSAISSGSAPTPAGEPASSTTVVPEQPADPGAYRLVRTPPNAAGFPVLDASQRAVVDHFGGPLLVLAGPGTGKTTTLVEAVAERVRRGTDPERILVLTFSRRAAVALRDRMAERITGAAPQASTVHSFCYGLVRAHQDRDRYAEPLRLLSGPEQDLYLRELLGGQLDLAHEGRALDWPSDLRACLTTRGFADELRNVLARAREAGLSPRDLGGFADRDGRPDWRAAADFFAEYLDVTEAQGVLDYAELVHRAARIAEHDEHGAALRDSYDAVFVDEYQDTDPAQLRLLQALCGGGRDLMVFGDPDQSVYAFRGADVGGLLEFPHVFPTTDGAASPVAVLTTGRRSGARLQEATRRVASRIPLARLPAGAVRAHREPAASREGGDLRVLTFPTAGAELDTIADLLRRAHLEDGLAWRDMAVLVRAGSRSLPGMRRALSAAGVPLETDGDDLPLRDEPAVAPLLTALRVAAEPAALTTGTAHALLTSPLGGSDATALRRLGRALRQEERDAGRDAPAASDELITQALTEPARLVAHDPRYADAPRRLGELLATARDQLRGGAEVADVLWHLWQSTGWPGRLERAARRGGSTGRNADRDLDAVCVLFDVAARAEERTGGRGALNFLAELESHDIAGDTRTVRGVGTDAVRLMTAHRAKGLEWPLVVVASVQEGLWPDLRRRGSLLEADRIGPDGLAEPMPPGALLAEERRLFYVAATRARERLIVTAVRAGEDGDQPSRFLTELGVEPEDVTSRPRRPLSVAALVAELRAVTVDPEASPALREAAVQRLARLAALREGDREGTARRAEATMGVRPGVEGAGTATAGTGESGEVAAVAAGSGAEGAAPDALHRASVVRPSPQGSETDGAAGTPPGNVDPPPEPVASSSEPMTPSAEVATSLPTPATPSPGVTTSLRGAPLVPAAHPHRWWGLREPTAAAAPVRDPRQPVGLSGSALDQLVHTCSLQWFLSREVAPDAPASTAQGFGNVLHVLADDVASGTTPADLAVLLKRLEGVWESLAFEAPWHSRQEHDEARAALERFLRWHVHQGELGRATEGSEQEFAVTLRAGQYRVRIRGVIDRVERDTEGRRYVVDFKTGTAPVSRADAERNPQLAVYQLALRHSSAQGDEAGLPSGGELVYLRAGAPQRDGGDDWPLQRVQSPLGPGAMDLAGAGSAEADAAPKSVAPAALEESTAPGETSGTDGTPELGAAGGDWVAELLATAAGRVLDERFAASPGQHCAMCGFRSACSARTEGRQLLE